MHLFPAIDIRNGCVVRLSQGEGTRQTVYESNPLAQAERFVEQGAEWIHVVDLDRAFGEGDNGEVIARLARRVAGRVRVQAGGGVRTLERARELLDAGVSRIVLGTAAVTEPDFVPAAVAALGADVLAVGLDVREGRVAVRGWRESSGELAEDVARRVVGQGIRTLIYTDIARDGMLAGPDVEGAAALQRTGTGVITSGGVSTLDDVRAVADAGLAGAIVGRALYERRFTLREAIRVGSAGR